MIGELPQDAMVSWRKKALDRFTALGFPRPKQEGFQYLPLADIRSSWPAPASRPSSDFCPPQGVLEAPYWIVLVDGYYQPTLSKLPPGVLCTPIAQALRSYGLFLQNRWTKQFKEEKDPFAMLNAAVQGEGAFLYIPPKVEVAAPIQVLHVATTSQLGSPRLQVTMGSGASAFLALSAHCLDEAPFVNGAIDLALESGARLRMEDLTLLPPSAHWFYAVNGSLKRDASLEIVHATNGARAVRFSAQVELGEENSSFLLQTLSLLSGARQSHVHARVEHAAPHCQSRQHVKMALAARARSSFEGKIYVRPAAQKTEAYQLNNNLLLSDEASANAKPNLEIFADDVKASHGATVAQLKDEELFYLRSRGLARAAAEQLLLRGFCREILNAFQYGPWRKRGLQELDPSLYRNNSEHRDFGQEAPRCSDPERATIAEKQDASGDRNGREEQTPSNTNSSGCFGTLHERDQ